MYVFISYIVRIIEIFQRQMCILKDRSLNSMVILVHLAIFIINSSARYVP
jgi:hypothetical protein